MNTLTDCTRCGIRLDDEEFENPRLDKGADNEPICDQCYRELYELDCPLCEEHFDDPQTWEPNQFIYAPWGVPTPGIYRVLEWPFYGGPLLGDAAYDMDAIEFVKAHHKPGIEEGNFICPDCIKKYLPEVIETPVTA